MNGNQTNIRVYRTARDTGERLTEGAPLALEQGLEPDLPSILVDSATRYQEIEGFGGAFTEAAAVTLSKMSGERRTEVLKAYFDVEQGHGYTLCRTHINSCDFALGNYAYSEVDGDVELEHFDIARDRQALIPLIQDAQEVGGGTISLLASPWSPPAWMKTNGQMNFGGQLKPEYRDAWARYYVRYIRAYEKEGIPIWGLTVQNEPEATQTWDSCRYTAEEERDFVRDHLGPVLAREGLSDLRVLIWDRRPI
jgi:glucosylceramidase